MSQSHANRLPDFLAVGPQRTGTTWLHRALLGHVGLPEKVKETGYWDVNYERGLDWYLKNFRHCDPALPMGEICGCFGNQQSRKRIHQQIPNCKIIVSLRDPVERAYSHYKLMRRSAYTKATFEQVLDTRPHIVGANRYAFHLSDWFERFGRERVFVCLYDDLSATPQRYLDRICDFIGIAKIPLETIPGLHNKVHTIERQPRSHKLAQNARHVRVWLNVNRAYRTVNLLERAGVWGFCFGGGAPYPSLTPEQDARLRERFLPEVEATEKLLGLDLSAWKRPRARRDSSAPRTEAIGAN